MSILAPFQLLELNIISAQDLHRISSTMKTYAVAWVHPDRKLSTRVDTLGGTNPTWNDKFVFRVDENFLHNDTSAVMIEIYATHWFRDIKLGTVRALIGNLVPPSPSKPFQRKNILGMQFGALQVRRSSGRPQGILNIGVAILDSSMRSMPLYTQLSASAVGYKDLMGEGNPLPFLLKPELRRVKSASSSIIGMTEADRMKREGSIKGGSMINGSDFDDSTVKGKKGKAQSTVNMSIKGGSSILNGSDLNEKVGKKFTFDLFAPRKSNFDGRVMITESELGPSPSEVAAVMARRPTGAESSILDDGWSLDDDSVEGLQSKLERWRTELPAVFDRGGDFNGYNRRKGHNRRHTDGDARLFSCFSNICGCQCSISCGPGAAAPKKRGGKMRTQSPSVLTLSFV